MKIYTLGSGDAFSVDKYNSSLVVQNEDGFFGIECPHPYFKILKENSKLDVSEINSVFISHLHGDHMNGLEDLLFYKRFFEKKRIKLYAYENDLNILWDKRLQCAMGTSYNGSQWTIEEINSYIDARPLLEGDVYLDGGFLFQIKRAKHHIVSHAIKLKDIKTGRSVSYSGDTAFDMELIEWMSDADIIIHECNYGCGHTTYESLLTLPENIKNKMKLTHLSDSFNYDSDIPYLSDGEVICFELE